MKGFFAVAMEAIQQTDLTKLKAPLTLIATADEESTMSGARFLSESGLSQGEAVIIGEPTSLKPVRMHKGISMQAIRITGRSGHSSNPELGNNALEAMSEVLGELQTFRTRLQSTYQNSGFAVTVPTLNLGCIHGGDNPNRICGQCELQYDLRPLPGMAIDDLRNEITTLLEPIADRRGVMIEQEILFGGVEAFEEPASSELVTNAENFTGTNAESVAFATEAPFYKGLGKQTIILGPGSIDQAHQPNEYLPDNQVLPAIDIYRRFIQHYCL
jgi:acetylornithine deacetylase